MTLLQVTDYTWLKISSVQQHDKENSSYHSASWRFFWLLGFRGGFVCLFVGVWGVVWGFFRVWGGGLFFGGFWWGFCFCFFFPTRWLTGSEHLLAIDLHRLLNEFCSVRNPWLCILYRLGTFVATHTQFMGLYLIHNLYISLAISSNCLSQQSISRYYSWWAGLNNSPSTILSIIQILFSV